MKGRWRLGSYMWATIGVFSAVFFACVTASYLWRSSAHAVLEQGLANNLKAVGISADLRLAMRRLEWLVDRYSAQAEDSYVTEAKRTVDEMKQRLIQLTGTNPSVSEMAAINELREGLGQYAERFVKKPHPGGHPGNETRRKRRGTEIIDDLKQLRQINVAQMERQRLATQRASIYTFAFMAGFGLISTWALALILSREVIQPLDRLTQSVLTFDPAQSWQGNGKEVKTRSREIALLEDSFSRMATRLKVQYERLRGLGDLRGRLVSMVSHEYGNAMTGILSGVALLEDDSDLPPERKRHITSIIRANAKTMVKMAEEFLAIARSGSDRFALELKPESIPKILQDTVEFLKNRHKGKEVEIACSIPDAVPSVLCHASTVGFVVSNLLGNALKYTRQGGRIEVGVARRDGEIECWVEDNGIGMDQAMLDQALATDGYRSAQAQKMAMGFGIGLSLVQDVLEAHGSQLQARSELRKGSRFAFRLKVAESAPKHETVST